MGTDYPYPGSLLQMESWFLNQFLGSLVFEKTREVWVSVLLDGSFELLGGDFARGVSIDCLECGSDLSSPARLEGGTGFLGNGFDGIGDLFEAPLVVVV